MSKQKPTKIVQAGTRMPEALRAALEKSAKARGTSLNAEIVHRLEESFRRGSAEVYWEQAGIMLDKSQKVLDEARRIRAEELDLIADIEKALRAGQSIDEVFGPPNKFLRRMKK